eukprot:TRINITY_DN32066_c0_g1_i1.p1 TRINITY_DN32066_c0_g1~~TRINITY_DN32066_c0_g1_i1.p1  ORF type:complete len:245 (+),score=59.61 TRINITY_DN32066_c0_g1_i1:66-800(+)
MPDGKAATLPPDTQRVFDRVITELAGNLQYFIDCVPALAERFHENLETVRRMNPKAAIRERLAETTPRCKSPLVRTSASFSSAPGASVSGERLSEEVPPTDRQLITQMHALKSEAYEVRVMLSGVLDWIEMQAPPLSSDDPRGVHVQEAVVRHLAAMRGAVQVIYDRERMFMDKIADYASKFYENTLARDRWGRTIVVLHEENWDQLERDWRELRHIVVLAARLLSLNMSLLLQPEGRDRASYL